ncbi:MAG: hypothetical protein IT310_15125 [Anaerolineales bacterium]|nr:hypothetical protein [Anaerolineales bacterium]
MNKLVKPFIPPILFTIKDYWVERFGSQHDFEYIAEGWQYAHAHTEVKGWDVGEILEIHKKSLPIYLSKIQGSGVLGFSPESAPDAPADILAQNTVMVFAYALALSAWKKERLSMLDWGGAIGQYYALAQALMPEVNIEYHCKDFPLMADYGRTLFPDAYYYSDDACFTRTYDFVLASGSLQYSPDWKTDFRNLAASTEKYLLLTRLPTVEKKDSFVFVQRPRAFGYNTDYLAWCINKNELARQADLNKLELEREFLIGDNHSIVNAPEQCRYSGFLYRKME